MQMVPTLTDGIVTLRGHRDDDIERCLEQCVDPVSIRWTTVPTPYTRDDAAQFVRHAMPGGWETDQEWGFAVEYGDRYAGTISLRNEHDHRAEIAYGSHPDVRGVHVDGRTVMERALRLLLEWGFTQRDLQTVIWWANKGNWASRKVAWKLGFSFDGTVSSWLPHRGELLDGWVGTLQAGELMESRTPWLDCPAIELEAIRLRPPAERDADRIAQAWSHPSMRRWAHRPPQPFVVADALAWMERTRQGAASADAVAWTIADSTDDRLLGVINLFGMAEGHPVPTAEIGYWVHHDSRDRGVATAATRAALRHAFADTEDGGLGRERVFALCAVANTASRTVLERAGLRKCGIERSRLHVIDGYSDAVLYDVLAREVLSGD